MVLGNNAMTQDMPLSTFALSDLALQSAVELAKARAGSDYSVDAVHHLATALSQTVSPASQAPQLRFVEPAYYEPFERLFHHQQPAEPDPDTVEAIQSYFTEIVARLQAFNQASPLGPVDELQDFCVALHRELIRELTSDGPFVRPNWRRTDFSSSFGFG